MIADEAPVFDVTSSEKSADLPPDMPSSTYELLRGAAEAAGGRTALTFFLDAEHHRETTDWSYAELFEGVTRTANVFHGLGVRPGDVIACMLPNLPETHLVLWGGETAGIIMPINPLLDAVTCAGLMAAAGARILVTLAPFPDPMLYGKALEIACALPDLRHVVLVDPTRHLRGLRGTVAHLPARMARLRAAPMPRHVSVHDFHRSIRRASGTELLSRRRISPDERASYFCTGGTTGRPKIAVRTHGQEIANAWMAKEALGPIAGPEFTVLCGLPLFHVNAVIATGLVAFLTHGRVVLGTPQGYRSPALVDGFWEIASHHGITAASMVPTVLAMLLDRKVAAGSPTPLRCVFSGAAPLSPELLRRFEETHGVAVVEGYGMTETACIAAINPVDGDRRAGSVGRPLPSQDIDVVMVDRAGGFLRRAEVGEVGLVTIAGPNVFCGYLEAEQGRALWIDRRDDRRWLNTGDLGRFDADGYLWLAGRVKDLIIRGGHNIDPAVIEDAFAAHPDVALAAAIGRPDAHAGEVPVVYVRLRDQSTATAEDLLAHATGLIGERAAIPRAVEIVEDLPLTPIGKVHKPTLRLREAMGATRDALERHGVPVRAVDGEVNAAGQIVVRIDLPPRHRDACLRATADFTFTCEQRLVGHDEV